MSSELSHVEAVRRRPGMYFGDIDAFGLHHTVWEIIGNVIDLHLARLATALHVDVTPDAWVTVRDDGPGIPPTIATTVCTTLHTDGTFDGHAPHVHITSNLRGVGITAVNAASTHFELETTFEGRRHRQSFERGLATSPLAELGPSTIEGTSIRFHPDPAVFTTLDFNPHAIRERLQELAWLNPRLRVYFQGEHISGAGGLAGWLRSLAVQRGPIDAAFSMESSVNGVSVDLAVGWVRFQTEPTIYSFVNMNRSLRGTHVDGLYAGFAAWATTHGATTTSLDRVRERLSPTLIAMIHVGLHHPQFGNPTREHLVSPEAGTAVARTLATDLTPEIERNEPLREHLATYLGF